MRTLPGLAALVLLGAVTGCSDPLGPEEDAFRAARARWAAAGIADYTFDLQRLCFCGPDYTGAVSITVADGAIVAAVYRDSGDPFEGPFAELYTVEDLFAEIQDAIRREAHSLEVEYDTVLGYPTDIAIDYSVNIADEERGYLVSDFDFDGYLIQSALRATTGSMVPARLAGSQLAIPATRPSPTAATR